MSHRSVVVFAAAPIAVGQTIEVAIIHTRDGMHVRVRDLSTLVMYGGANVFTALPTLPVYGIRADHRSAALPAGTTTVKTFLARVIECVVSNVKQRDGHAPCTSFVVEVLPDDAGPYR